MVLYTFDGVWRKDATDMLVYLPGKLRPTTSRTHTKLHPQMTLRKKGSLEKCSAHNVVVMPDTYICPTEDQFKENDNDVAGNDRNLEVLYRIVEVDSLHYQWRLRVWIWRVPTVFGEEPRPADDQRCICEQ